ncbi:MAG: T9SS type A sorting domain-containing protein [Flavobacteriales bacterium]
MKLNYLEVPTADYSLQVQTADGTPVADLPAPLATMGLTGQAITVFASGFLNPMNNSNGPAFGLWVALASGGPLVELTNTTGITAQSKVADQLLLYPNPASTSATLELRGVTGKRMDIKVADVSGRVVMDMGSMEMAPTENTVKLNVSSLASGSYRLILNTTQASTTLPLHIVR